jgi:type I restriction enzyme S subunit
MGENLYELPKGWMWVNLGDILETVENTKPSINPENEFIYLDIASIDNSIQKITEPKTYLGKDAPSRARQLVKAGDILFSTVRTYLKNIATVPEIYHNQIASTGFCVIRPYKGISQQFIFLITQNDDFLEPLNQLQRGTSYPAVRDSDVFVQKIPLPPLAEQYRIVAKIEELFTQLDAGVELLKKVKAKLKRYRQAVLKAAVEGNLTKEWRTAHQEELEPASVLLERILKQRRQKWEAEQLAKMQAQGKTPKDDSWKLKYKEPVAPDTSDLPDLPDGWYYTFLKPLLCLSRGMKTGPFGSLLKKHEHQTDGITVLGIENIATMKFIRGSKIHITKEKSEELSGYNVQPGDILISRSGTVGEVCVVPDDIGEARISTNLMRISLVTQSLSPVYFCFLFNGSPYVLSQVSELCKGSTRDFLNQDILSSIVFPIPSFIEQQKIIEEVELIFSVTDQLEKTIDTNIKRAEKLRQSILKQAFTGQLVPQDPKDEPAEKLLERIKAEKAKQVTTKTKKKTTSKSKTKSPTQLALPLE